MPAEIFDSVLWIVESKPERLTGDELYPTHSGTLKLAEGITLKVYRLNDGQNVIDAEDVHKVFSFGETPVGKNWSAEDYRRSADVHDVAEEIIKHLTENLLKLAHIRHLTVLDDCPSADVIVKDVLPVALGEDTGCNDPEDLTAENCELLWVEEQLREMLKRVRQ